MRKLLCIFLLCLLLCGAAFGEAAVDTQIIQVQVNAGQVYSFENFGITLPSDLAVLSDEERAGYDAAVAADFPKAPRLELMAVNADRSAAVCAAVLSSEETAADVARGAAERMLGTAESVVETKLGQNDCACFACLVDGRTFNIYVIDAGEKLAALGICGFDDAVTANILSSLEVRA